MKEKREREREREYQIIFKHRIMSSIQVLPRELSGLVYVRLIFTKHSRLLLIGSSRLSEIAIIRSVLNGLFQSEVLL